MNFVKHSRSSTLAALLSALILASSLVLVACGGDDDDESSASRSGMSMQESQGNGVDRAFVKDMVPHHESAVEMAEVAQKRGQSTFVKDLADDIVRTQKAEITKLKAISSSLQKAGVTVGDLGVADHEMGMDMDMASLRNASPFDRAFIDMMIPHHQGAIRMARAELAKGKDADARKLATEIIAAQSREITAMNAHRKDEFGAVSPAGGIPTESSSSMSEEDSSEHGSGHG